MQHSTSLKPIPRCPNGVRHTLHEETTGAQLPNREFEQRVETLGAQTDPATYASLLRQCGKAKALSDGKRVHEQMIRSGHGGENTYLGNLVVQMYGKCGRLEEARAVFDGLRKRNVFSWTIIIAAYAQNGHFVEALQLYQRMDLDGVRPNEVTFASVLDACTGMGALAEGQAIHARIIHSGHGSDVFLGGSLIVMYGKCGSVDDARKVFDRMPSRSIVSWNAMIGVYSQHDRGKEALELFHRIEESEGIQPNEVTYISVLGICSSMRALAEGQEIHRRIILSRCESVGVGNCLINMYGKCGSLDTAKSVFDKMPQRDLLSWNGLIAAYAQNGHPREAIRCFEQMELARVEANEVTYISILALCSDEAALARGKAIHASILSRNMKLDVVLGTALVDMYAKCGSLDSARSVFDQMKARNVITWNAMVAGYAQHGHAQETLELVRQMHVDGFSPNASTFVSVLYACSQAGLLHEGLGYFLCLSGDHPEIGLNAEHYGCMIDLFGRVGLLKQAEELITSMPFEPIALAWMSLLSACKVHCDMEKAKLAAERAVELEPWNEKPYILLSNVYGSQKHIP